MDQNNVADVKPDSARSASITSNGSNCLMTAKSDQNCNSHDLIHSNSSESVDSIDFDCNGFSHVRFSNCQSYNCQLTQWEQAYRDLHLSLTNERKLFSIHQSELSGQLKSVLEENESLKVKCVALENRVGVLESEELARIQFSRSRKSKSKPDLKQLGLSEDILLALPFGYATKIRSAFEKLDYENEKLQEALHAIKNSSVLNEQRNCNEATVSRLNYLIKEKEQMMVRMRAMFAENNATSQTLQTVREEAKVQARLNEQVLQLVALLGKEVEQLRELLKNCRTRYQIADEAEQQTSFEELRLRCCLLSSINTNILQNNRKGSSQAPSQVCPLTDSSNTGSVANSSELNS